ncbi:hypothetical protein EB118_04385 [bacterium]|nr:hypothetical protein [bacterium]NBX98642.1 hypothetical protein [bacterium]NDC94079.1 hypothetical protein [bacterium]NDD83525.1 hypothetical protein [bacterium]NDG29326.1 hypothetical protein [bacterium]
MRKPLQPRLTALEGAEKTLYVAVRRVPEKQTDNFSVNVYATLLQDRGVISILYRENRLSELNKFIDAYRQPTSLFVTRLKSTLNTPAYYQQRDAVATMTRIALATATDGTIPHCSQQQTIDTIAELLPEYADKISQKEYLHAQSLGVVAAQLSRLQPIMVS